MYSDQLIKNDKLPFCVWLAIASGLAFLLLVALFQVVNGQVEQAGIRQAQFSAAQTAIAGCAASYPGVVRRQCMEQANALAIPDGPGLQSATFAHR